MENVFIFIIYPLTLLISYFVGRYSRQGFDTEEALKRAKKLLNKSKGMIINYPTAEEIEYSGSEQEKIDKEQEKLIKEAGIV